MNIIDKIKNELAKRLQKAADAGFIEIRMKASNDVVVITPDGPADDPETIYELRGFKLFNIFAVGLDELAKEVLNYDKTVAWQQELISRLYHFKRMKIDTGLATAAEKRWYAKTYESVYWYDPIAYAESLSA